MKRTHHAETALKANQKEINTRVAFHEAGHAAAIYFGNQQKGLPPVFFQISFRSDKTAILASFLFGGSLPNDQASVEGGHLINILPTSVEEATKNFSNCQKLEYQLAFEADIVNILAGPLAEAKYVAMHDGELISPRLLNMNALHNYGGLSDLENAAQYLDCISEPGELREEKIAELFQAAFNFVNERSNWLAITALAEHILTVDKNRIGFDEIAAVLEVSNTRKPS